MPSRPRPPFAALAILAALFVALPSARAGHVASDDSDTDDSAWDRDQRKEIREAVRGWTWAVMPPVDFDDHYQHSGRVDDSPNRRLVRVTALAATASGDAIVGGAVRGPLRLGGTSIGMTLRQRGFIARVDRGGRFRMIHLAERETYMVPSALAVDRAGRIVVSYEDASLEVLTADGRHVWSRNLPPARALAFATNGDILAAGCRITKRLHSSRYSKQIWHYEAIEDGYFARISAWGEFRWTDRLDRGQQQLFYRPNDRDVTDCATGIVAGPGGDAYVAGDFTQSWSGHTGDEEPSLPVTGIFLARVSDDGRIAWSRLVASGTGRVDLATTRDGSLVVVAGQVAELDTPGRSLTQGLAAFDADGVPVWSLPIMRRPGSPVIDPAIAHVRVAAHRAGNADFVCIGSYGAPIAARASTLAEADGGVFLAEVDRRGSVTGLRGVPGRTRPKGAGGFVTNIALGPGPAALWIGGTMTSETHGGWVQAVPW